MANIWLRKPVEAILAEANDSEGMKRTLSAWHLVALGIGGIIGSGIFVLTGQAAAKYAGPAIVISFILAGLAAAFAGLCYAEFAAMLPISGSAYAYSYATMGELLAWIIGWDLVLEYLFGASTVAVGWSGYIVSLLKEFHIKLPPLLTQAPFDDHLHATGAYINLPAVLIIGLMTMLLVRGIQESAFFNNLAVVCKVGVILALIAFGWQFVDGQNWQPFIPANNGTSGEFGWSGILRASGVIFFAYIGFDAVSTASQEARNPQRDMPIGILGSLVICTVLYILVALVLTGIVHYTDLNVPDPIAVAVDTAAGLAWLRLPVKFAAVAGLSSVILVLLMGQPRIFYSMAKDGLLPPAFGKLHPVYKTPAFPTILTGVIAALMAGLFPIGLLGEMVSIGTLLAFVLVCGGVLVMHYREPNRPRPFKTPLVPLTPLLGIFCCFVCMYNLPGATWARLVAWMALGILIYFMYGAKHSLVQKTGGAYVPGETTAPGVDVGFNPHEE